MFKFSKFSKFEDELLYQKDRRGKKFELKCSISFSSKKFHWFNTEAWSKIFVKLNQVTIPKLALYENQHVQSCKFECFQLWIEVIFWKG